MGNGRFRLASQDSARLPRPTRVARDISESVDVCLFDLDGHKANRDRHFGSLSIQRLDLNHLDTPAEYL